jgi:C-terminal processing protease CtpA/Prc
MARSTCSKRTAHPQICAWFRCVLSGLFFVSIITTSASKEPVEAASQSASIDRLVTLCKLWNAVRFFDPDLRDETDPLIDSALLAALPHINEPNGLEKAARIMLVHLHDPVTMLDSNTQVDGPTSIPTAEEKGAIHIVHLNGYPSTGNVDTYSQAISRVMMPAASTRGIVVDLRTSAPGSDPQIVLELQAWTKSGFLSGLSSVPIELPRYATRQYVGFTPETESSLNASVVDDQPTIISPRSDARDVPVAILADHTSVLPSELTALVTARKGAIFISDDSRDVTPGGSTTIKVSDALSADVRLSAPMPMPLTHQGGLQEAAAWLARPTISGPEATAELPIAKRYADNALPDSDHRMLALFRIWGTIKYFDPYQNLISDWDGALRVALRDVQGTETSFQYAMTIAKLYAHINDSHGFIRAPGFVKAFALPMPFVAQNVQGELTIVRVDPALARRDGYNVGDVIKTIDGETIASKAARLRPFIPASTRQAAEEALDLDYGRTPSLLAGPVGSTATLGLEGPAGHQREVRIRRQYGSLKIYARTRPAVDVLPGDVGYVDLPRLTAQQVDAALDRVGRARAIIFDLRGYPPPNFAELASHFTRVRVRTALFRIPVVHSPFDGDEDYLPESRDLYQSVASAAPMYAKPVVVLINAMAISRAEHTALFLKAAANATFVGQPTEGADGGAVTFFVPGALGGHPKCTTYGRLKMYQGSVAT